MTGRPGVQAHRRVPRSGAIGNAGRAGPHDMIARDRRCAAPPAARAPHLAEAALCRCLQPPLLSLAQAQQPHDAQESDQQAPGAAHRRSPPTALGRRNRACLPGAGRAPAEEACARPAPPRLASLRPPRSRLPCGRAATRASVHASLGQPHSCAPRSRTCLRSTWPAARPAQRRGPSGVGVSPEPTLPRAYAVRPAPPRPGAHAGPFLSQY